MLGEEKLSSHSLHAPTKTNVQGSYFLGREGHIHAYAHPTTLPSPTHWCGSAFQKLWVELEVVTVTLIPVVLKNRDLGVQMGEVRPFPLTFEIWCAVWVVWCGMGW